MKKPKYHEDTGVGDLPRKPNPSDHFPAHIRDALVAASQTPVTRYAPLARQVAIDKAIERARAQFPELFIKEPTCPSI